MTERAGDGDGESHRLGSACFLECHGSDKKDPRNDYSLFANVHGAGDQCAALLRFWPVDGPVPTFSSSSSSSSSSFGGESVGDNDGGGGSSAGGEESCADQAALADELGAAGDDDDDDLLAEDDEEEDEEDEEEDGRPGSPLKSIGEGGSDDDDGSVDKSVDTCEDGNSDEDKSDDDDDGAAVSNRGSRAALDARPSGAVSFAAAAEASAAAAAGAPFGCFANVSGAYVPYVWRPPRPLTVNATLSLTGPNVHTCLKPLCAAV